MRRVCHIVLALGLAVLLAGPAFGQEQQRRQRGQGQGGRGGFGFGMGGGGYAMLLTNEGVQKELKLDESQVGKIKEATQGVTEKHRDDFAKLRDLPMEERGEKMREMGRTINEETLAAVSDILKPDQLKRLKQIELQRAGTEAFTRADVQKALNLTSEQKDKIKTISEDEAKERRALAPQRGAGGAGAANADAFRAMREKMTTLRKESMERVSAVLNADQKKTWKDLTGEPFEVQFQPQRRPGGGQ